MGAPVGFLPKFPVPKLVLLYADVYMAENSSVYIYIYAHTMEPPLVELQSTHGCYKGVAISIEIIGRRMPEANVAKSCRKKCEE